MDELDIDPVPEFACPWQSSSSCCDMPTTSENVLRDASPKKIDESRSANGDFDRAQLTVKVGTVRREKVLVRGVFGLRSRLYRSKVMGDQVLGDR